MHFETIKILESIITDPIIFVLNIVMRNFIIVAQHDNISIFMWQDK